MGGDSVREIAIFPRDPIISRDGRPFGIGTGNKMYSLPWLYPSVVAGSFRTMIAKVVSGERNPFSDQVFLEELKAIRVRGILPYVEGKIFLPRPANFLRASKKVNDNEEHIEKLLPQKIPLNWGVNLPNSELLPLIPTINEKPDQGQPLWSREMLISWLSGDLDKFQYNINQTLDYPGLEERTHVAIDFENKAAKNSELFFTEGLDFKYGTEHGLLMSVELPDNPKWGKALDNANIIHPLGGERRLAIWHPITDSQLWDVPQELKEMFNHSKRICMYLATPAVFGGGWRPNWLDKNNLSGVIPGTTLSVKLKGAAINRWQAVSGWSYEDRGPKPVRRLAPAGSVYFFDVLDGNTSDLTKVWLKSISDSIIDANDGFGLACWGVW